jgi:two-component system nitrate/nitrite sensor histidine kinase NarX
LISAFRVRIGTHGLGPALEEAVEEFSQRSELSIALDYRLDDCRLTVNEEFHVLQVMREALSNTVRHARAAHVSVSLACVARGPVTAIVEDDGKGFAVIAEQPSHYGLSVMRERAASLGGDLTISARPEGGTRVCLIFVPESSAPERTTGSFSL